MVPLFYWGRGLLSATHRWYVICVDNLQTATPAENKLWGSYPPGINSVRRTLSTERLLINFRPRNLNFRRVIDNTRDVCLRCLLYVHKVRTLWTSIDLSKSVSLENILHYLRVHITLASYVLLKKCYF